MASSGFSLLLLSLSVSLSLSLSLVCAKGNTDLIQKTCQSTNYNDLCVSSFESDPDSFAADAPGLALIIIEMGINSSLNTSSYASNLLRNATNPLLTKVLKQCLDCYTNAHTALHRSLDSLASPDTYDYAYLHVSAAMEYPGICHDVFKHNARFVYPLEMGLGEEALQHICDIALGIISVLLSET